MSCDWVIEVRPHDEEHATVWVDAVSNRLAAEDTIWEITTAIERGGVFPKRGDFVSGAPCAVVRANSRISTMLRCDAFETEREDGWSDGYATLIARPA